MTKTAKNLPTHRHGDGYAFAPTRPVATYLRIGFLAALGRPSRLIAEEIGDGISMPAMCV